MLKRLTINLLFFVAIAAAQVPCQFTGSFTTTGTTGQFDNRRLQCYQWRVSYNSTGFSALSIQLEQAPDNGGVPGSWTAFAGATVVTDGSNPSTNTNAAIIGIHSGAAWVRLNLASNTGTGMVIYQVWGANSTNNIASTGNGGGGGTVTSVTASSPLLSSMGTTPDISCPTCLDDPSVLNPEQTVDAATTSSSDTSGLTYANGTAGVGATLTGTINTAFSVDGFTYTVVGQRLLVKNDTQSPSGAFNGVYFLSQLQTGILPPVFTRALNFDTPTSINYSGLISIINGTINIKRVEELLTKVTTIGTNPISFAPINIVTGAAPITVNSTPPYQVSATYQGNGGKIQQSTGSTTTNDCVKYDSNSNTVDSGNPCGTVEITFTLCGGVCTTGDLSTFPQFFEYSGSIEQCSIASVIAPTGSGSLTVDIFTGTPTVAGGIVTGFTGTSSIFSSTILTLAASSTGPVSQTGMSATAVFTANTTVYYAQVKSVGGTIAGGLVTVKCIAI